MSTARSTSARSSITGSRFFHVVAGHGQPVAIGRRAIDPKLRDLDAVVAEGIVEDSGDRADGRARLEAGWDGNEFQVEQDALRVLVRLAQDDGVAAVEAGCALSPAASAQTSPKSFTRSSAMASSTRTRMPSSDS